jgi:hypothetical protein
LGGIFDVLGTEDSIKQLGTLLKQEITKKENVLENVKGAIDLLLPEAVSSDKNAALSAIVASVIAIGIEMAYSETLKDYVQFTEEAHNTPSDVIIRTRNVMHKIQELKKISQSVSTHLEQITRILQNRILQEKIIEESMKQDKYVTTNTLES